MKPTLAIPSLIASLSSLSQAGVIHRWSFDDPAGAAAADTQINDSVGTAHAFIRGTGASFTGTAVSLPGGGSATAPYIDLPNGILSSIATNQMTLETWVTVNGTTNAWARIFDFGTGQAGEVLAPGGGGNGTNYLILSAARGGNFGQQRLETRLTPDPGGLTWVFDSDRATTVGTQMHIVVSLDSTAGDGSSKINYWRNGEHVTVDGAVTGMKLNQIQDVNNWLGRSNWSGDANLNGSFNEFRIYDAAFTQDQVDASSASGPVNLPADSDGDGMPDGYESANGLNPAVDDAAGDLDSDGSSNLQEFQRQTNPQDTDTDDDGATDGSETKTGVFNSLTDRGTDPLVADTDGDAILDGAESNTGINLGVADRGTKALDRDTDDDGIGDGTEVAAGTDPNLATSLPGARLVNRYSFSSGSGRVVSDSTGGAHGIVAGASGFSWTAGALRLPGGSARSAPYADLPNHLISNHGLSKGGSGSVTVEGWVTVSSTPLVSWPRIYDFGSSQRNEGATGEIHAPGNQNGGGGDGLDYFMLTAYNGTNTAQRQVDIRNQDPAGADFNYAVGTATVDSEFHFVVTWDETSGNAVYYENGVQTGTGVTPIVTRISSINDVNVWLGRSNWNADANTAATYNEFRIYEGVLPADVIAANTAAGPDANITTPAATDADNDGMANWFERAYGLNPADAADAATDLDGDTLTNLQEFQRGLSPRAADSDADGYADNVETGTGVFVSAADTGTSPRTADSDFDCVLDKADGEPNSGAPALRQMAHRWTFNDLPIGTVPDGTVVADIVGGSAFDAVIRGTGATADGNFIILPGGANNDTTPYVDLPNGIISSTPQLTAVTWVKLGAATNWSRVFDFGASNGIEVPSGGAIGNGTEYMFLSAGRGPDFNLQRFALQEAGFGESFYDWTLTDNGLAVTPAGQEVFIAVTVDSSSGVSYSNCYRDGVWLAVNERLIFTLSQINDVNNWLGRSQYAGDPTLTGSFNEFRIYNSILNCGEIRRLYAGGPEGLRILDVQQVGADLTYTWNSKNNLPYTAEASDDLQTWTPLQTGIPGTGDVTSFTVPVGTGKRYFRARLEE